MVLIRIVLCTRRCTLISKKVYAVIKKSLPLIFEYESAGKRKVQDIILEKRAKRADKKKFEKALAHIPDVEPEEYDRL